MKTGSGLSWLKGKNYDIRLRGIGPEAVVDTVLKLKIFNC